MRRSLLLPAAAALVLLSSCGNSTTAPELGTSTSTTAGPSTTAPPDRAGSDALLASACAGTTTTDAVGTVPADLDEISGLAASRQHEGVLWTVEDSLEPADVVAVGTDGTVLGTIRFEGTPVVNLDWEDLALAPGPDGTDWLHVADVGDNFAIRREVDVYRFPEPSPQDGTVQTERTTASYEGGPIDAEALAVTVDGTWIVGKVAGPAPIYRLDDGASTFVDTGASVDLGEELVTAVDVSADGTLVAVRTYEQVHLFSLGPEGDLAAALQGEPCSVPVDEPQGETVALLPAGAGIVTISETGAEPAASVNLTTAGG